MDPLDISMPIYAIVFWGMITFSLVVVVHEIGHFATAKLFGVTVHEFVIGLPGPMLRWKTRFTTFGLSMIPLGGYVRIAGMEPGEDDPLIPSALAHAVDVGTTDVTALAEVLEVGIGRSRTLLATLADWGAIRAVGEGSAYESLIERAPLESDDALHQRLRASTFRGQSLWKRLVMLGTGVALNLLFAISVFVLVLSVFGYQDLSTTVELVEPGTPAAIAGIEAGDRIVEVDGEPIETWFDVLEGIAAHEPGDTISLAMDRAGETVPITATLADEGGGAFLGIRSEPMTVTMPLGEALRESLRWTGLVFEAVANLFNPDKFQTTVDNARGVIGVSVEAARAWDAGVIEYASLLALISLSLGALNIFPIPPLDGGKMVLEVVGAVMGRPVRKEVYIGLTAFGALLIFSLIGYLVYADIIIYVVGG